jgi:hypothetical protein
VPVRSWILLGFPLLWAGPLAVAFAILRVPADSEEADAAALVAWVGVLAPMVGAVVAAVKLRPMGWPVALWILVNSLLGLVALALTFLLMLRG